MRQEREGHLCARRSDMWDPQPLSEWVAVACRSPFCCPKLRGFEMLNLLAINAQSFNIVMHKRENNYTFVIYRFNIVLQER